MNATQRLILEHPANAQVLAAWCEGTPSVTDVIGDTWQLGTHPDLVEHFYAVGQAGAEDNVNVKWVVCGYPGLVNPNTGVIYGLAIGTSGFFLRLPEGTHDFAEHYGNFWSSVEPFSKEAAYGCLDAYIFAGEVT